jgi:hypothetical protein
MADKSLFPAVTQFGFDPGESTDPNLHLVFTIWIACADRRVVLPVNTSPNPIGQRLGYMVFEATGVMQAGLEAFQLIRLCLEQPEDLPLSTHQQVFAWSDRPQLIQGFLNGIVPHA